LIEYMGIVGMMKRPELHNRVQKAGIASMWPHSLAKDCFLWLDLQMPSEFNHFSYPELFLVAHGSVSLLFLHYWNFSRKMSLSSLSFIAQTALHFQRLARKGWENEISGHSTWLIKLFQTSGMHYLFIDEWFYTGIGVKIVHIHLSSGHVYIINISHFIKVLYKWSFVKRV
jgi:hypothetical protein